MYADIPVMFPPSILSSYNAHQISICLGIGDIIVLFVRDIMYLYQDLGDLGDVFVQKINIF